VRAAVANALALGFGSLLPLGLGEVGLRLFAPQPTGPVWFTFDPELGALPTPGEHGERTLPGIYRFSFTNDAQGLRADPTAPGAVPRHTVLVLGDSFTYGLGVNDDQTFCHVLQEELAHDLPTRVVNAGSPGKGTDYALRFLLARQATLRPDLVLLAFFKNDFGDNARDTYFHLTSGGRLEPRPPRDARSKRRLFLERFPGFGWLLSRSHLINLLRQAAVRLTAEQSDAGQPTSRSEDGPPGPVWVDESRIEHTRLYLKELRDATSAHASSLLVFYVPDFRDCWLARQGRPLSPDESAFREVAADLGLQSLSLTPALAGSLEPLERLYFADGHWTPTAHALVARALQDVTRNLLAPRRGGA
jgi:hypothetical protein